MDFTQIKRDIGKLPQSKREIAQGLLNKAEFMESELRKLQEIIVVNGWTENYQNGANQFGKKKSSEADCYNIVIKNYTAVMKALADLLPKDAAADDTSITDEIKALLNE